jgi:hypothetical protein
MKKAYPSTTKTKYTRVGSGGRDQEDHSLRLGWAKSSPINRPINRALNHLSSQLRGTNR